MVLEKEKETWFLMLQDYGVVSKYKNSLSFVQIVIGPTCLKNHAAFKSQLIMIPLTVKVILGREINLICINCVTYE